MANPIIECARLHFRADERRRIDVPEWGSADAPLVLWHAPVTLADARASLELITAIYHSGETGVAVTLPIPKDHPKYNSWVPAKGGFPKAIHHG